MTAPRLTLALVATLAAGLCAAPARAQFESRWLSAGSYHNWYSAGGSEREEGLVASQQYGARWPGIYDLRDQQAAKGLWIGAQDVTDEFGNRFPVRVVHVGPRALGVGEFFPTRFELVSKFNLPVVTVDGDQSFASAEMAVDTVDPEIAPDVMLISEANTLLGVSMERRVMQFSQAAHDNYHVIEYTFTNTGNTDGDDEIELPNQTLEGLIFYLQYRLSVARETRYVIGNPTSWGKNAMNDARGDGVLADPPGEDFRAQFTWHGNLAGFSGGYDNTGGPIVKSRLPALGIAPSDTLGRLGSSSFIGVVTLQADASASDDADDPGQPSTTNWVGSDDAYQSNNDPFSVGRMTTEYGVMSQGHESPRHAYAVEPTGLPGFLDPSGDPSLGTSGGFSFGNGYGPYTLGPGESVRFVVAEGAAGMNREANTTLGRQYQASGADDNALLTYDGESKTKNEWVFTSRDSLFQTFRRAIANYESDFGIPRPPQPPASFAVNSGGDRIQLAWDPPSDPAGVAGFEIYRAQAAVDSAYTLIASPGASEVSFADTTPTRGVDYYYYIVSVGNAGDNSGAGQTPPGALRSSRYYTQTYVPARLKRPQGRTLEDDEARGLDGVVVVPNPFNISSSRDVRFPDRLNKLAFYNIPGFCEIEIFTEIGELVDTIVHNDGSGDAFWDHSTASRQIVTSGIYIAVITVTEDIVDLETGETLFQEGERAFRKFAIIR